MKPEKSQPILRVPLHIVGGILAQLDSMKQLAPAILSHRLFLQAFNDNTQTITTSIILNQIPERLLPFVAAVHRSTDVDTADHDVVRSCLSNLEEAILNPRSIIPSFASFTPAQVATMSNTYTATLRLCQCYADDITPVINERLGINHPRTINQEETFRLARAFLRFQLSCNLFCPVEGEPLSYEERSDRFFNIFSPWVNDQLRCVYTYLETKVVEAFDEVAAHDIVWGELPIRSYLTPSECPNIQGFLCQSLSFLSQVCSSGSYDEWSALLQLELLKPRWDFEPAGHLYYELSESTVRALNVDKEADPLESYGSVRFEILRNLQDGPQDDLSSSAFRMWFLAHKGKPILNSVCYRRDTNLFECGYVIWDYPELHEDALVPALERANNSQRLIQRAEQWDQDKIRLSENRRSDIFWSGGSGYWPSEGIDFSRVQGLSGNKKQRLLHHWGLAQPSKPKT
ncbi:hypothetical protein F4818DRAFT_439792 [Hypoxylon cercidicola]|nr:hypothetical protein F4818DRAFT_439792 [Hypoxylon cercidicola]